MAEEKFPEEYQFGRDNIEVVIQHKGGGSFRHFLRVVRNIYNEKEQADPYGEVGMCCARWIVEKQDDDDKIKLKSRETGKYLRIGPNAKVGAEDEVDVKGTGGKWTVFKVHKQGKAGYVKLESAEQGGKYLAVQKDNTIRIGNGGPWTEVIFFKKEVSVPFTKPYMFQQTNIVVIQHKGNKQGKHQKFLRVKPGDLYQADADGGKGRFGEWEADSQWEADPQNGGSKVQFKSTKSGRYLRINFDPMGRGGINVMGINGGTGTIFKVHKQGNGTVKFESEAFPNAYLAVGPGGNVRPGNGGPFTNLFVFRKK